MMALESGVKTLLASLAFSQPTASKQVQKCERYTPVSYEVKEEATSSRKRR